MNKSKAQLKSEFTEFFEKDASPLLGEYEAMRKKDRIAQLGLYLFLTSIPVLWLFPPLGLALLFLAMGFFCIYFNLIKKNNNSIDLDYEMNLKKKLMPKFLAIFGDFKWSKFLPQKFKTSALKIRTLNIFPKTFFMKFDDFIEGKYLDINIEIVETLTGRYSWTFISFLLLVIFVLPVIFIITAIFIFIVMLITFAVTGNNIDIMGIVLIALLALIFVIIPAVFIILDSSMRCVVISCKIPKPFKGKTFMYENAKTSNKLILKDRRNFEEVNLEDVNFNKMYTVFSTDQVEARYLLTTGFMERFQNIKTAFDAKYIRAEFKDGELVILIGVNKDMFAMGNLAKQTTYKTFFELFEEMYSVLSLVEHLKLNQNIGL